MRWVAEERKRVINRKIHKDNITLVSNVNF